MAHKKKTAEEIKNEVKNAYVELENGLQELMTSEKYLDFLNRTSKILSQQYHPYLLTKTKCNISRRL